MAALSYGGHESSLAIWNHAVLLATRHKWKHLALTPARGRYLIYLPQGNGRLSWCGWLHTGTEIGFLLVDSYVVTGPDIEQLRHHWSECVFLREKNILKTLKFTFPPGLNATHQQCLPYQCLIRFMTCVNSLWQLSGTPEITAREGDLPILHCYLFTCCQGACESSKQVLLPRLHQPGHVLCNNNILEEELI